jgi:hypothetical protein
MAQTNQAYDLAYYGWMMHIVGAVLWLLLGLYEISEYFRQSALMVNPPSTGVPDGITNDSVFIALVLGIICIILAMVALVWSVLIRWRILDPLQRQEYEYAARNIMLMGAFGMLLGFGAGGALLMLSLVKMKEALRVNAVPTTQQAYVAQATPLCPTCGNAARYIPAQQRWHCDNCARFL